MTSQPLKKVSKSLIANYVTQGRREAITPLNIVTFSGKVIYPPDVKPRNMKTTPNDEGGFDLRMETSMPSIAFSLDVKAEYVSVGLCTDPKRLVIIVDYKIAL